MRIELALHDTRCVQAQASTMTNAVDVTYQPERTTYDALKAAIGRAGYRVVEPKLKPGTETDDPESRRDRRSTARSCANSGLPRPSPYR